MTHYVSYLYMEAENLSTDILFPFNEIYLYLGLTIGVKTAFPCKFRAALVSASISINSILFDRIPQTFQI